MSDEQQLRFAVECKQRGDHLPANFSGPLKRAGLITALHQGWGFYSFEFTAKGAALAQELTAHD